MMDGDDVRRSIHQHMERRRIDDIISDDEFLSAIS
jgi:hypothetical protein